ncbi:MAG: HD domain-containing phosphohydrolase [Endomicrobiia bacterium]
MAQGKILFVDDDLSLLEFARKVLTDAGYEIEVAKNGIEALQQARKQKFDLIITDLQMPVMSGEELIKAIKSDYADTDIIVLTVYPTVDSAIKTLKLGVYDYILKPFNVETMTAQIERVFNRRKLLNELKTEKQLKEKITMLFEDMQDLFLSTIKSLSEAIEAKDKTTYGHCERLRDYSIRIGKKLNFTVDEIKDLEYASLLHDVGKIAIPESILSKPGKLTKEEFDIVKTHSIKGVDILGSIKQLSSACVGIKYHHERYDGNGYPEGLKGEEIPLIARIISVGDAFDAMTSDRPYRKKMRKEDAISILIEEKNKQFDGNIVEKFIPEVL